MDRLTGVTPARAGWVAKLIYRGINKRIGRVPKGKTLQAYDTGMLVASTWMDAVGAKARTIPPALKELAQLKVAALVGCPF
ncbi:MAG: hypothetical protein KGM92_00640 [Acidobacteriota bacterium]|jgi:hypothetical protein|nr:hypothetical protein [Acidobacteriota bacterium]